MTAGYSPAGMKNRKAYVTPGSLGWGIDSRAMNPMPEMQKGMMMKGQRVRRLSASLANRYVTHAPRK